MITLVINNYKQLQYYFNISFISYFKYLSYIDVIKFIFVQIKYG